MKNFERITVDPAQMDGVPCVRDLRIPVATVLQLLAEGLSKKKILAQYPGLQTEDIRECLRFAAALAMERQPPLPRSALRLRKQARIRRLRGKLNWQGDLNARRKDT